MEASSSSNKQRLDDMGAVGEVAPDDMGAVDEVSHNETSSRIASPASSYTQFKLCKVYISCSGLDVKHKFLEAICYKLSFNGFRVVFDDKSLEPGENAIYDKLSNMGVQQLLDDKALEPGDSLSAERQTAIDNADVHIAILSERYADSPWFLAELSYMVTRCVKIIPIFYCFSSFTLSMRGIYSASFAQLDEKGKYTVRKVDEWRDAVRRVSSMDGCLFDNDYLEDHLEEIVEKVVKEANLQQHALEDLDKDGRTYLINPDIFIHHRHLDTGKSVASLLNRCLSKHGLRVCLSSNKARTLSSSNKARTFSSSNKARTFSSPNKPGVFSSYIMSSLVHVAIFSVEYAESSQCLNELSYMLQSGRKVIPIFHDVKPADLSHIEGGRYAKAFRNHQNKGRHDMELVKRWKDALQKVSNISGIEFNTNEDDFGDLVEKIVEEVLKEAKLELYVAEHPVGLHQAEQDFNFFLKERQLSGTTVVNIIGLHGSGKSTLVKHLYNRYLRSRKFKRYRFLSELNEKDLTDSQQELVRDLLGDYEYSNSDTTKKKLPTDQGGCGPVLIVLDGLQKAQIKSLLLVVKKDVLAEGSLILVTSDKSLFGHDGVDLFYEVRLLKRKDAHALFCCYAFDLPTPRDRLSWYNFDQPTPRDRLSWYNFDQPTPLPKHLEDLVEKFLNICDGFPSRLKCFGQKLSLDQDRIYWEEQLEDFRIEDVWITDSREE